jgi:hypothetical protein
VIHVFLKNKLIALDVISPLLLDVSKSENIKFNIITFDEELIASLNDNVILRDVVNRVGNISYVGRYKYNNLFFSKIVNAIWFIKLGFRIIFTQDKIIHFGHLNKYPLKFFYLLNKKQTFICDKKAWKIYCNKATPPSEIKQKCKLVSAYASINFSMNSSYVSCDNISKRYMYSNPKGKKIWVDYVKNIGDGYIKKEMNDNHIKDTDKIISLITGHFGTSTQFDSSGFDRDLIFLETLIVLSDISKTFPIAIKTHIYSDQNRMNAILRMAYLKSDCQLNYYITKLHPGVLATKSAFAICASVSSTFYDFKVAGVPTVSVVSSITDKGDLIDSTGLASHVIRICDLNNEEIHRISSRKFGDNTNTNTNMHVNDIDIVSSLGKRL